MILYILFYPVDITSCTLFHFLQPKFKGFYGFFRNAADFFQTSGLINGFDFFPHLHRISGLHFFIQFADNSGEYKLNIHLRIHGLSANLPDQLSVIIPQVLPVF